MRTDELTELLKGMWKFLHTLPEENQEDRLLLEEAISVVYTAKQGVNV